jgi:isopenicillin N synthase-like dioxygenase
LGGRIQAGVRRFSSGPVIPVIDLSPFTTENPSIATQAAKTDAIHRVAEAASQIGFLYLKNSFVHDLMIDNVFLETQRFFNLGDNIKRTCSSDTNNAKG